MVPDPVKRKARDQISLVQVIGWVNRFLTNVRKHQNDRVRGELTPRELRQAEEQIIKMAQQECFPDEIQALKTTSLFPTRVLYFTMGASLDQTCHCDIQMICQTIQSFQSFKESHRYQVNCEVSP